MANEFTLNTVARMEQLRAELAQLEAMQAAMSPEESVMLSEDSDMDEAMLYAMQDRDLRRRAAEGDAMANTLLRGEDPPSPQEPPEEVLRAMRMDGMGAGPRMTE